MEPILLIDDDVELCSMLTDYLGRHGYHVSATHHGKTGLEKALGGSYALLLLDVMLPGLDGFEVLRRLRAAGSPMSVLLLTARGEDVDRIVGLEIGADDYLPKPFNPRELLARIRAVLRRAGTRAMGDEVLIVGPIGLDRAQREVTIEGEPVKLTFSEFELLDALMADPGRLLNRQELLRAIWGDSAYRDPRAIDVHIRHLREKLEPEPESTIAPGGTSISTTARLLSEWMRRSSLAGSMPFSSVQEA